MSVRAKSRETNSLQFSPVPRHPSTKVNFKIRSSSRTWTSIHRQLTRLDCCLPANFFHYKWQNVPQPTDLWNAFFFRVLTAFRLFPKWRAQVPTASANYDPRQQQHHAGAAIGYCDPVIGPARSCTAPSWAFHLPPNAHLLFPPFLLSRRCLCLDCSPNSFSTPTIFSPTFVQLQPIYQFEAMFFEKFFCNICTMHN